MGGGRREGGGWRVGDQAPPEDGSLLLASHWGLRE